MFYLFYASSFFSLLLALYAHLFSDTNKITKKINPQHFD